MWFWVQYTSNKLTSQSTKGCPYYKSLDIYIFILNSQHFSPTVYDIFFVFLFFKNIFVHGILEYGIDSPVNELSFISICP